MAQNTRMAYLVSQYPAISHTFILREVLALRKLGFEISVASVNSVDRPTEKLTQDEQDEARKTLYLKRLSLARVLWDHLCSFAHNPFRFLQTLFFALRLGQPDLKRMLYGILYFAEAVLVARWMRKSRLPHLHVHFATPAAMVGLLASRLTHCSLSITVHGPDEFYDVTRYQLAAKIAGCSFLCVISQFARSQLMKVSSAKEWRKFEVTPLGIDPQRFPPKPTKSADGRFEVLCVGRLVPAKGQHILIEALHFMVNRGGDACVRFVGDGPDRQSLELLARQLGVADRVFFEGSVNQDRIGEFYKQANAFVLPSFAEGVPVVLMEAMSVELPCITTRITGIPELIRDGIDGLLVTPSDSDELASAMLRLMKDPSLCRDLGKSGRKRVVACYDLDTNTKRLAEVLRKRLAAA